MTVRATHTYAVLDVSPACFREVKARLEATGSEHAICEDGDRTVIDMHGLALAAERKGEAADVDGTPFECASLISRRTRRGMVEMSLGREKVQMEISKAREAVRILQGAVEAATSDQVMWDYLTTKVGLAEDAASVALLDLRALRQGSRGTVYPN